MNGSAHLSGQRFTKSLLLQLLYLSVYYCCTTWFSCIMQKVCIAVQVIGCNWKNKVPFKLQHLDIVTVAASKLRHFK